MNTAQQVIFEIENRGYLKCDLQTFPDGGHPHDDVPLTEAEIEAQKILSHDQITRLDHALLAQAQLMALDLSADSQFALGQMMDAMRTQLAAFKTSTNAKASKKELETQSQNIRGIASDMGMVLKNAMAAAGNLSNQLLLKSTLASLGSVQIARTRLASKVTRRAVVRPKSARILNFADAKKAAAKNKTSISAATKNVASRSARAGKTAPRENVAPLAERRKTQAAPNTPTVPTAPKSSAQAPTVATFDAVPRVSPASPIASPIQNASAQTSASLAAPGQAQSFRAETAAPVQQTTQTISQPIQVPGAPPQPPTNLQPINPVVQPIQQLPPLPSPPVHEVPPQPIVLRVPDSKDPVVPPIVYLSPPPQPWGPPADWRVPTHPVQPRENGQPEQVVGGNVKGQDADNKVVKSKMPVFETVRDEKNNGTLTDIFQSAQDVLKDVIKAFKKAARGACGDCQGDCSTCTRGKLNTNQIAAGRAAIDALRNQLN